MDSITKKAYAKINLTLDVIKKLDNGYHELKMIMQQISMHDVITVSKCKEDGIFLDCNKNITEIKDNIVYKACQKMKEKYNIKEGIKVQLEKNIFIAAGLAGGSTDCATTMLCINELFDLKIPLKELMELGGELGKDVVYCVHGGLALATYDGTVLEPLNNYKKTYLLVANPNFEVSTKYVFDNFNFSVKVETDYENIINAINNNDIKKIGSLLNNNLEQVTVVKYPVIDEIKKCMLESNAVGSIMSGSGATVFGIFEDEGQAFNAEVHLKNKFPNILSKVCYTI